MKKSRRERKVAEKRKAESGGGKEISKMEREKKLARSNG